jgi:tRNA-dihydrouridine synthase A
MLLHFSIAPMMDWTTRHCRVFHRLLSPHARLYTEMVTTGALMHGDRARHLDFDPSEHPVALQLGGSEPHDLAASARLAAEWGYDEINLNCGCPSDRVQKGAFGACLMSEPVLVAECVAAMKNAAPGLPVTVKCRIGIDDVDPEPFLDKFVSTVRGAGCQTFIIHARKAWLKGLSPKENREIPPLDYPLVTRLKARHPDLTIVLNGGLTTVESVIEILRPSGLTRGPQEDCEGPSGQARGPISVTLDGIMIGRAAYQNPYFIAELEHALFGTPLPDRAWVVSQMNDYWGRQMAKTPHLPVGAITRHMLGLFHGEPRARA